LVSKSVGAANFWCYWAVSEDRRPGGREKVNRVRKSKTTKRPQLGGNYKSLRFKQSEIERCIRAMRAMNVPVGGVEMDPHTGKIKITTATEEIKTPNEWDKAV